MLARRGSEGTFVRRIQERLNDLGAGLVVDGQFGPATDNAVRQYQRMNGLDVDGVVGPATWRELEGAGVLEPEVPSAAPGAPLRAVGRPHGLAAMQIVLHESTCRTRERIVSILRAKRCGVHYIVTRDARVTQHVSMEDDSIHAVGHNEGTIAVEVENRYYGSRAVDGESTIRGVWVDRAKRRDGSFGNPDRLYILPTPTQMEAVWGLVVEVTEAVPSIPRTFPAVRGAQFYWGTARRAYRPGIVAHHRSDHADGLFAEFYCWARSLGLPANRAWSETVKTAGALRRTTSLVVC